jgi:hypothetical protein
MPNGVSSDRVMSWRTVLGAFLIAAAAHAADDAPPPATIAAPFDFRSRALARELQRMYTIKPEELVSTIDEAVRRDPNAPSLSLLLAIAHAETSGDVLDVSEAGAVGLAQATPVALRQEGIEGTMYVTRDYLDGARAYIVKKPLRDIEVIAGNVVDGGSLDDAARLLESAMALRHEGVDELDLLKEWADASFYNDVRIDESRNWAMLMELAGALHAGDRVALCALRDRAHDEYRASLSRQQAAWKRYQADLIKRRDALLEERFRMRAYTARRQYGYVAGDMLAEELDVRFSPSKMAAFLVSHLSRKATQAESLATSIEKREEMTAALYNGGTHNVKRMLAGLITSLPETENYMRKVPAIRKRLDRAVEAAVLPLTVDDDPLITPIR